METNSVTNNRRKETLELRTSRGPKNRCKEEIWESSSLVMEFLSLKGGGSQWHVLHSPWKPKRKLIPILGFSWGVGEQTDGSFGSVGII
ncbi:hypothetical protein HPP92_010646 [Vanilla planifolia]|uniref:Uncharacterized protein n=1 Tax=Vanilla planifolia TaxID=51239 RepID=A0A835RAV0_VANPL|nr:hypothetical protein HPP92_010646 [Vanilla planifolia]